MKADWTNARSAVGIEVAAWLAERINVGASGADPFAMTVGSWDHEGRLVSVEVLDRWLTPVGVHLSELPDDCWRWSKAGSQGSYQALIEQVLDMWTDGAGRNEIARTMHIAPSRVDIWVNGVPGGLDLVPA